MCLRELHVSGVVYRTTKPTSTGLGMPNATIVVRASQISLSTQKSQ